MLVTASFALAGALNVVDGCRWNRPGADRYTGNVVAAVDHYADIPPAIRDRLKARMAKHQYDDVATITRDAVRGKQAYEPEITDMHFGENRVCREVTRKRWRPELQHKGLVYCEEGYCLLLPTVCGNLSRIQRVRSDEPLDIEPAAGPAPQVPAEQPASESGGMLPLDLDALPPTAAGDPQAMPVEPMPQVPLMPYQPILPYNPYVPVGPFVPPPFFPPPVTPAVPEPAQIVQVLSGVLMLAGWAWMRRRQHAKAH